jgi:tetratricopeptide (TPR) repeat protein
VLEIDPNHINAAYARGACENKRGNFAKAIEDYNMALEKDQERPVSPSGSRKIRVKNMNYILEMPLSLGGLNSQQSSAQKNYNNDSFNCTADSS